MASDPPVFACVIPSRPVQSDAQLVPPNRFVFSIQHAETLNHLVVFLTGAGESRHPLRVSLTKADDDVLPVALPEGCAASVHFFFPTKGQWQVLGMISADKPSAIFRLRGTAVPSPQSTFGSPTSALPTSDGLTAQLGVFVAPVAEVLQHVSSLPPSSSLSNVASTALVSAGASAGTGTGKPDPVETVRIARACGQHVFNYLSSFVRRIPDGLSPDGGVNVVEFGAVEKWWRTFEQKCRASGGVGWLLQATEGEGTR